MYYPPKGFFTRLVEAAFLFALAAWLVRVGICLIQQVWVWIVVLVVIAAVLMVAWRLYKHYKDTHF